MTEKPEILLVDKPVGLTSFDVVRELKRTFNRNGQKNIRIGHTGTLDPFATGLLIICLNQSLNLVRYLLHSKKTYSGTIEFGKETTSGDATSPISETTPQLPSDRQSIQTAATTFETETYHQLPPMMSALKQNGTRLYSLARQGIEVERETRICQVEDFKILSYDAPFATFQVTVSGGTYVRTLAEDLAKKLQTLGHLKTLRRESIEKISVTRALPLATWIQRLESFKNSPEAEVSPSEMLRHLPSVAVEPSIRDALNQGRQNAASTVGLSVSPHPLEDQKLVVVCEGEIAGVLAAKAGAWRIERMFSAHFVSSL